MEIDPENQDDLNQVKKFLNQSSFFIFNVLWVDSIEYIIPSMPYCCLTLASGKINIWHGYFRIPMEEFLNRDDVPEDVKVFLYFNMDLWRNE